MAVSMEQFKPAKDYLICVDSDGCAVDTMDIKHKRCFGPCLVVEWGLERWKNEILARWDEINLYSMTRGINRFMGLTMMLEEVDARFTSIDGLPALRQWAGTAKELSNPALEAEMRMRYPDALGSRKPLKLTVTGLLLGLGSGIGYGLYSILGTIALRKYSPYTVTTYTFLIAAAGSWFVCSPADLISRFEAGNPVEIALFSCLTGLVTAVIPFLAYTLGLRTVEASKAGILATIEPMVATLVGMIVFSEPLTLLSGLGIVLILTAVILLNRKQPAEK